MITRTRLVAAIVLLFAIVGVVAVSPSASGMLGVPSGHTLFHANCPPGSHGKPRYDGVGQTLEKARAARPLATRSITAP
jgi:hypothetical protein